ncbi:Nif11-like leader peptide family natural product precursor [Nostoc sp. CHAB 5784]|uniref:Nif11-like leader peptide family natural product precursor n=1 Tax=Nostoc mirabile TaxID=2907820 RepID=UPI001E6274FE|nr:Nif11-like leader peptide family natural product precursor [Nostoc mirabile]MCC5668495.1 Nif11-like leader peptide family natural product precursor [Nostoc mirabile CHAB5784]
MSQETVREFFKFAENDEVLQEQIKAAKASTSVIQIAAEKGYEFTAQELEEYMKEAVANEELNLEELEAVAGGVSKNNINNNIKGRSLSGAESLGDAESLGGAEILPNTGV